jgi:hypothetical protein
MDLSSPAHSAHQALFGIQSMVCPQLRRLHSLLERGTKAKSQCRATLQCQPRPSRLSSHRIPGPRQQLRMRHIRNSRWRGSTDQVGMPKNRITTSERAIPPLDSMSFRPHLSTHGRPPTVQTFTSRCIRVPHKTQWSFLTTKCRILPSTTSNIAHLKQGWQQMLTTNATRTTSAMRSSSISAC